MNFIGNNHPETFYVQKYVDILYWDVHAQKKKKIYQYTYIDSQPTPQHLGNSHETQP